MKILRIKIRDKFADECMNRVEHSEPLLIIHLLIIKRNIVAFRMMVGLINNAVDFLSARCRHFFRIGRNFDRVDHFPVFFNGNEL